MFGRDRERRTFRHVPGTVTFPRGRVRDEQGPRRPPTYVVFSHRSSAHTLEALSFRLSFDRFDTRTTPRPHPPPRSSLPHVSIVLWWSRPTLPSPDHVRSPWSHTPRRTFPPTASVHELSTTPRFNTRESRSVFVPDLRPRPRLLGGSPLS